MPGPNLLIGNGEVLAGAIVRDGGFGGNKAYPYTIQEARDRLRDGIAGIAEALDKCHRPPYRSQSVIGM